MRLQYFGGPIALSFEKGSDQHILSHGISPGNQVRSAKVTLGESGPAVLLVFDWSITLVLLLQERSYRKVSNLRFLGASRHAEVVFRVLRVYLAKKALYSNENPLETQIHLIIWIMATPKGLPWRCKTITARSF